jgi:hypothetical protein
MRSSKEASRCLLLGLLHFVHCRFSCNRARGTAAVTICCRACGQSEGRTYKKHGSNFRHIIPFLNCVILSHMSVWKVYGKLRCELPRWLVKNQAILRKISRRIKHKSAG